MIQRILVHLIVMVICPIQKVRTSTLLELGLYGLDTGVVVGMMSYSSDLLRRVLGWFDVDHICRRRHRREITLAFTRTPIMIGVGVGLWLEGRRHVAHTRKTRTDDPLVTLSVEEEEEVLM